jgi:hypothetical protein
LLARIQNLFHNLTYILYESITGLWDGALLAQNKVYGMYLPYRRNSEGFISSVVELFSTPFNIPYTSGQLVAKDTRSTSQFNMKSLLILYRALGTGLLGSTNLGSFAFSHVFTQTGTLVALHKTVNGARRSL